MTYTIHFYRGADELPVKPWLHGLTKAKEHAKEYLKIHKADRVEVRNDNGDLCFHWPRIVKRVPNS